jgi:SAM-dependent methyltransferase
MSLSQTFPLSGDLGYTRQGSLDNVPNNVSFLASEPGVIMNDSTIHFKWHASSQHLVIENSQPPSYYEDYVMTTTYSDKMQSLQRVQMEKLVRFYEAKDSPKSFVEIGCGDGSFMKHARQKIPRIFGIEPSHRFAQEALRDGFEVTIGYVSSKVNLTDEKFDTFVSRQVFEHLPDPLDVLVGIRQMLSPGAVGLIEVPNGQRALRLKRFFEFFPDHVNYFSVNSLVALASDAGFNVISCEESFGGDYLELWLRNEPDVESWFPTMVSHREKVCLMLAATVSGLVALGTRVAIWGCGAKTLSILAACPDDLLSKITCIVDSDPHKHGMFVPNTLIPVVSPSKLNDHNAEVMIVLALSYREEIANLIRAYSKNCNKILSLDDHGSIIEL